MFKQVQTRIRARLSRAFAQATKRDLLVLAVAGWIAAAGLFGLLLDRDASHRATLAATISSERRARAALVEQLLQLLRAKDACAHGDKSASNQHPAEFVPGGHGITPLTHMIDAVGISLDHIDIQHGLARNFNVQLVGMRPEIGRAPLVTLLVSKRTGTDQRQQDASRNPRLAPCEHPRDSGSCQRSDQPTERFWNSHTHPLV